MFYLLIPILTLLGACNSDDMPRYTNLDRLRVMALVPSSAEVDPGATVTITPYVSDIYGAGRTLTYTAVRCHDPGIDYGATPTCDGSATRTVIATNTTVTGLAAPSYTGAVNTFSVTIPSSGEIFAGRSSQALYNGVGYLVTYTVTATGEKSLQSFTRIVVSTKTPKNAHPTSLSLLSNGQTLTTLPTTTFNLSLTYPTTATETFSVANSDGSTTAKTEILQTTWFITEGSLKRDRTLGTDVVSYSPPTTYTAGRVRILAVTRDGRGGIAVTEKTY